MNKDIIINRVEKYLNICFKNIRIASIEEIKILESIEENNTLKIKLSGDKEILKTAFNNIENVIISEDMLTILNILEENSLSKDLLDIIKEINFKIEDFNNYATNRKPISFF